MKVTFFILVLTLSTKLCYAQKSTVEKSGDFFQIGLPILAFSSTLIWNDDSKPLLRFTKTMGISILLTHALKRLINKPRPNGGNYSFPSGHTSSAFTGAAFIQKRHGWKFGIPAYIIASYVGWTRIHTSKHDTWDIIGGASIGIASAYLFTKPFRDKNVKISLIDLNSERFLLGISYKF